MPLNPSGTTVYAQSAFYPESAVLILHFTPSLRFTLSLQSAFYPWSAVCSPQSAFYTDHFLNSQNVQTSNISVDLQAIDNSLQDLKNASYQSAYSKQKCSLHTEFEKFLASLPNSKTILPASPTDINCFLAWKDLHGKMVVHSDGCSNSHLQSTAKCKCAKCLGCRNLMAPSLTPLKELNFL